MGNPHPTLSKPVKIGKKHTNQPRTKARQRQENTKYRYNLAVLRKKRKYNHQVRLFFI
jgi:hypothetical protein